MEVSLTTVNMAALPPKVTVEAPVKPVPVRVTLVPPAGVPVAGVTLVRVGTGKPTAKVVVVTAPELSVAVTVTVPTSALVKPVALQLQVPAPVLPTMVPNGKPPLVAVRVTVPLPSASLKVPVLLALPVVIGTLATFLATTGAAVLGVRLRKRLLPTPLIARSKTPVVQPVMPVRMKLP